MSLKQERRDMSLTVEEIDSSITIDQIYAVRRQAGWQLIEHGTFDVSWSRDKGLIN